MLTHMEDKPIRVLLAPKMKAFADNYILTGNASASASKAGYSHKTRGVTGAKLLKRPDVQAYIAQRTAKEAENTEALGSQVIQELKTLAFANIADFITIDDAGRPQVDFSGATDEQLRAIASVKSKQRVLYNKDGDPVGTETETAFAMADKYRGLDMLAKHLGLYKAEEQRVVLDVADRLLNARARLRRLSDGDGEIIQRQGGGGTGV